MWRTPVRLQSIFMLGLRWKKKLEWIRCWIVYITDMPTFIKLLLLNKRCNIKGTLRAEMHYSWQEAADRNWMMEQACSTHFNSLCVRRVCGQVCVFLMKVLTVWPFSICSFIFSSSSASCSCSACNLRQTHTKKTIKSGFELCRHDVWSRSLLVPSLKSYRALAFAKIKTLIFGFETGHCNKESCPVSQVWSLPLTLCVLLTVNLIWKSKL